MKRITLLTRCAALLAALFAMYANAQQNPLTLHDLVPGGRNFYRYMPKNLRQLQWCADRYCYVQGDSLLMALPTDRAEQLVATREQLSQMLTAAGLPSVAAMPQLFAPAPGRAELAFYYKNRRVHFDPASRRITADYRLKPTWSRYEYDAAGGRLAFTEGNNVFILSADSQLTAVTAETDEGIVCGTSVHQNEFGITKGLFWSPKGDALAFYRMDQRMIADYPIVDIEARKAALEPVKYPMAGMPSHHVTVGVYRLADAKTVWLETGEPAEKFLTNIAWSPDGRYIYIAELNRDQNDCRLVRYDATTGRREAELFAERHDRYVEPQNPIRFVPGNASQFVWESQRDGYNHLYLYNADGRLLRQLTSGRWVVTQVLGFDADGKNLFYTATAPHPDARTDEGSPLEIYAWRLNLKTGRSTCLTPAKRGVHHADVSPSGLYLIDRVSSPAIPRDIDLVAVKNSRIVRSLLNAPDPYRNRTMPSVTTGTLTAGDGKTPLYYRLTLPPALDKSKKYPVVIYVYGGPHAQMVTGGWMNGVGGWDLYMAQRGYVVFTVDGRGSMNRGFEFESVIHRQLGVKEMEDQMKGVEYLKSLPYVDAGRIGVFGWSFGGFMTTNLMLTHPDVFKVGVAGGPVIDWTRYEIMYGERYMDHPDDNPEGYKQSNLALKAGHLKGNLLLIHGDSDPVVLWQHSLLFLKACIDADVYPDYFVYPRHPHNVIGKDRPHLMEKITRYFDTYL